VRNNPRYNVLVQRQQNYDMLPGIVTPGSSAVKQLKRRWIPAFAGMTAAGLYLSGLG
jgi:hypothetical protein